MNVNVNTEVASFIRKFADQETVEIYREALNDTIDLIIRTEEDNQDAPKALAKITVIREIDKGLVNLLNYFKDASEQEEE